MTAREALRKSREPQVASQSCCNFAAALVPFAVSLSGCHLLLRGLCTRRLVAKPVKPLAADLGELDPVAGVVDLQVEDRPDEREAALLAGEPSDHLRPSLHLAERSLEQVGRSPALAVPQRIA